MAEQSFPVRSESRNSILDRPVLLLSQIDYEKVAYLVIILLTIVSRFWGLGDRVVSHDESLHTHYSFQYFDGDGYVHTPLMHGPFLFHITAFSYWLFGASDFSARIPVALFGLVLVVFPYFFREWIGRVGALFASFVFLISPYTLYYSRYIRHDVYVIVWALIVFAATWYYFKNRDDRSLYWFAFGTAMMFATKEVAFIYVAIFGSFLIIRLLAQIGTEPWFYHQFMKFSWPAMVIVAGLLIGAIGGGFELFLPDGIASLGESAAQQVADPNADISEVGDGITATTGRWLILLGIAVLSFGLFALADKLRHNLIKYPEFDLIIMYTTLVLPMMVALLVVLTGRNPLEYGLNQCAIIADGGALQAFFTRISSGQCWSTWFSSTITVTMAFMGIILAVSIFVGTWWDQRRWLGAAIVFHVTFALLYTSLFSNPQGWLTGSVGSLGYWLEQQEVARGGQPWFYYGVVVPFYEFLPVIFTVIAIRYWTKTVGLFSSVRYWTWLIAGAVIFGSLIQWNATRNATLAGTEGAVWAGYIFAGVLIVLALGIRIWTKQTIFDIKPQGANENWVENFLGFVPYTIWWLLLTIIAYSYAGEKMPWLSIHFVIPMALLIGWYFQHLLSEIDWREIVSRDSLIWGGLALVFVVVVALLITPLWLGEVRFGDQSQAALTSLSQFIGRVVTAAVVGYFLYVYRESVSQTVQRIYWVLTVFAFLSLLTIRFAFLSSFPNADYTTEYLVYAHGAPATKSVVLSQLEEMSQRLYGDMRLKVYYDNEASWPYTWYLRDFPARVYFGDSPSPDIRNADAILVGDVNYSKVDPFLENNFDYVEFIFLWWPMEDYRQISWDTIIGDPSLDASVRRGLGNPAIRQGLWDIFFYRDYAAFGAATGKNFDIGDWPLKREMRLYIRRDAKATLWDRGLGATLITPPEDPYAEGDLPFEPSALIGLGELRNPRNVVVLDDQRVYVADSGNHRIAVFDAQGRFDFAFGSEGVGPGQFSEPWGLTHDDQFLYVADTWNNRIQKFTFDGEFVGSFGQSGSPDSAAGGGGLFYGPRDVVLIDENRLMVTDTGNHRVQLFDTDGQFIQGFGGQGVLSGQFFEPVGLGVAPDGGIVVADTWNGRVQELISADGDLFSIAEFDVDAWDTSQSIENKPYVAVDDLGRIFVTDPEGYRVLYFDRNGEYLGRFGTYSVDNTGFTLPNGIDIDSDNNIYVVDSTKGVVFRFNAP